MKASNLMKPKWDLHHIEGNPEHDLFEGAIAEYTDIRGIKVKYYIYDDSVKSDYFYGETVRKRWLGSYETKLIYDPTEEPTLTTGFGINSDETISFAAIPKFTFTRDVSGGVVKFHPKPGDVVVTIWNDRAYEIVDVSEEDKIFQLKKMVWSFVLKPFRFSEESESAEEISRFTRRPTDPDLTSTMSEPLTAFGDNEEIENESNDIDNYSDVDTEIYGY